MDETTRVCVPGASILRPDTPPLELAKNLFRLAGRFETELRNQYNSPENLCQTALEKTDHCVSLSFGQNATLRVALSKADIWTNSCYGESLGVSWN